MRLTLDDAVKLALDRNLDIAVQRLNPQINDIAVASLAVGLSPDADVARSSTQSHDDAVDTDASPAAARPARRSTPGTTTTTAASRRAFRGAAARSRSR